MAARRLPRATASGQRQETIARNRLLLGHPAAVGHRATAACQDTRV